MRKLVTLDVLPTGGNRFGTLSLGRDRVDEVRREFTLLRDLAASVCGVPPESVTAEAIHQALSQLSAGSVLEVPEAAQRLVSAADGPVVDAASQSRLLVAAQQCVGAVARAVQHRQ